MLQYNFTFHRFWQSMASSCLWRSCSSLSHQTSKLHLIRCVATHLLIISTFISTIRTTSSPSNTFPWPVSQVSQVSTHWPVTSILLRPGSGSLIIMSRWSESPDKCWLWPSGWLITILLTMYSSPGQWYTAGYSDFNYVWNFLVYLRKFLENIQNYFHSIQAFRIQIFLFKNISKKGIFPQIKCQKI